MHVKSSFEILPIIDFFKFVAQQSVSLKALVLEMYGTGNAPSKKGSMIKALRDARAKGIVIAAVTQCFTGGVIFDKYVNHEIAAILFFLSSTPPPSCTTSI